MGIAAEMKQGVESVLESAAEGWRRLSHQAAGAVTRFMPARKTSTSKSIGDEIDFPAPGWALLAGDVFEQSKQIVVRLEVPGMEKGDFDIEVHDDMLVVRGEKRIESESGEGRYHVLQCAYGSFSRSIPLPAAVVVDKATATYRNGVLKIELPKAEPSATKEIQIKVT